VQPTARRVENPVRDSYVPDAPSRREPSDPNKALVRVWVYLLCPFRLHLS
jgi:hypothetical protein